MYFIRHHKIFDIKPNSSNDIVDIRFCFLLNIHTD